jgi:hypothetical protein
LRNTQRLAFLAFVVLTALAAFSQASAVTSTKTSKIVEITFTVTPSPAPSTGFLPIHFGAATNVAALQEGARGTASTAYDSFEDPFHGPLQLASSGALMWDVAPGNGIIIAQVQVQPSPVPVQFVTKVDPNAAYLKVTYINPNLTAVYGTNTYDCPFEVFTYYTTAYALNDWGYGTSSSGGTATYPIENYPTTSYLSFAVEPAPEASPMPSPETFTAFYNEGTPGQNAWTKTAGTTYTGCFNLRLSVPTTLAPGTYNAAIQFNLNVAS